MVYQSECLGISLELLTELHKHRQNAGFAVLWSRLEMIDLIDEMLLKLKDARR